MNWGKNRRVVHQRHAKNKGWQDKISRHILFIERNLHFLKPGGRMAIVLPQGVFNNSSDYYIRDFIAKQCRILAVVGLHPNTFKPHTGTKTSVLFVQKWNNDPKAGALCPHCEDYPIFFATQQHKGKNNSGDKIFARDAETGELLVDKHGHKLVEHDLFSTDLENGSKTADGIAEAFIEFASKEGLSFFLHSAFNEVKYRALLDGLEISVVNLSEVFKENETFRIDSEFFQKHFLENAQLITSNYRMREFLSSESFVNIKNLSLNKNFNYLEISNVSLSGLGYATNETDYLNIPDRATYILKNHDIVISTVRPNRNAVAFIRQGKRLVGTSGFTVLRIDKLSPYYVFAFCKTKYFITHLMRENTATMYPAVSDNDVLNSRILVPSTTFQAKIEDLVKTAYAKLEKSKTLYTLAESLLLQALGLDNWQPPKEAVAIKNFSASFGATGRLDAEYYQPKYQSMISILRCSGKCIGNVATLKKRKFQQNEIDSFNYIEIGSISGEGYANSELVDIENTPSRAQWIVKTGDVITSTVRPIRRLTALIEEEQNQYVCSSGFAVLKPINIEPEVLMIYLRLPIICEIIDLHTTNSMYPAISTDDLLNIPIVLPKKQISKNIVGKIKASRQMKQQSHLLLFMAKQAIEIAIEQGEEAAINYLNQNVQNLWNKMNA